MTERRQPPLSSLLTGLAVAAWLGWSLAIRPLSLPDEGRYAGVAWEMLRSGDWLVPTLDGLPFFHKPPLFYWIASASFAAFGPHAWAARIAPWLGALLAAVPLWLLLRRWSEGRIARWALIILVTQPLFFGGAQFANLDMLVAGCITATIVLLADASMRLATGQQGWRACLLGAYAMAALGVLAKGLIGIVLPALVITLWLVMVQRSQLILKLLSLPGLLVFALVAAPWFIAMQQRFDDFAHHFFVFQHFQRYTLGGFNNPQPFWFYVACLGLLALPWSPGLWATWRNRAAGVDEPCGGLRVLMWVWMIAVVVFFSLPRSKLVGYVLPAAPPLAALIADAVWRGSDDPVRTERRLRAVALLAALLCAGSMVVISRLDKRSIQPLAQALLERKADGDAVAFVGAFYYDLPFHARLTAPVPVVEAWTAVDIAARDNWRKELYEASRFAPRLADAVLIDRQAFAQLLCRGPVTWVLAPLQASAAYPLLGSVAPAATLAGDGLWRFDRRDCPSDDQTPSAGLPGR